MMRSLSIVLALLAVARLGQAAPSDAKIECASFEEVLDDLSGAQGITSLNDKYKIVTSAEEQSKRCVEARDAIKTLRAYNKQCVTSLTQQVLGAILRTRSQMIDEHCMPNSIHFAETIEGCKCIQDNALEAVKAAERKINLALQVIHESDIKDEKERLRRGCCAVLGSKAIFLEATRDKCSKHSNLYTEYVDSYTADAMSLICPSTDKLACDKLPGLSLEGVTLKSKSHLLPIYKLVKSLDH